MKNRCAQSAIACIGAVVGAGFASGREVVSFFSQFGAHSWWLILLSAVASMVFSSLCMRAARKPCQNGWYGLYAQERPVQRAASRLCGALLMTVVGGAMVSASGHMVSLLWASDWAYPVGALGTLLLAWRMGRGSLKSLSMVSWALTAALMLAVLFALRREPSHVSAVVSPQALSGFWTLAYAALRAVCYAAMNITIAISVVCGCAARDSRTACRASALFGLMLASLLFVSNYLYLAHPELSASAFPIVELLSAFGRAGFVGSALLMYLAILTTLVALVRALRQSVESFALGKAATVALTLAPPVALSFVGFADIVRELYAPVGLLCILLILLPLARRNLPKSS